MAVRAFLELADGTALRIGAAGLVLGRHRSCDVQLADPSASRRHALLRATLDGVELIVLGRQPVLLGERSCAAIHEVHDGERLRVPGLDGKVRVERYQQVVRADYGVRRRGDRFLIRSSPFVVGGGAAAQAVIAGWPEEALRFSIAQGALYVELLGADGLHNGAPLPRETPAALGVGDELGYLGEVLAIEEAEAGDASTWGAGRELLATEVVLYPLPRGGRVVLTFADGERSVYLPGRRFQLISALVAPPPPHAAGEYIPDGDLVPLVWDDTEEVGGRQDLNVLLTRCRQDLVAAGIAATSLLERARGGRATRVRLAPGARVRVESA